MGRKCAVPHCYTGYRKCKEKASLYRVPDDDFFLSKWQEAIAREDRPITPKDYVCEKHFKEDDILRRRIIKDVQEVYQRPRLKPDAIPSIFPDLPEFILKMVKKRRKMPLEDPNNTETYDNDKVEQTKQYTMVGEIKTEPIEVDGVENSTSTVCETIINNELNIKSEPDDSEDCTKKDEEENENNDIIHGPSLHQCPECDYQTKYPHNLRTHQTKHLTGEDAYIYCKDCPKFKTKWQLTYRNHLKIKHGVGKQEIFKCSMCKFETKIKSCLKKHQERHQSALSATIHCDIPGCDFKNSNTGTLALHKLSHNLKATMDKSKYLKCSKCLFDSNCKTHKIGDAKTAGNNITVTTNVQKVSDNSNSKLITLYKCVKCSFKSKLQSRILKHLFEHKNSLAQDNKPASNVRRCLKCPFATFSQHALQMHKEIGCHNFFARKDCSAKSNLKPEFVKPTLTHKNVNMQFINREHFAKEKANLNQNNGSEKLDEKRSEAESIKDKVIDVEMPELLIKNEIPDV